MHPPTITENVVQECRIGYDPRPTQGGYVSTSIHALAPKYGVRGARFWRERGDLLTRAKANIID